MQDDIQTANLASSGKSLYANRRSQVKNPMKHEIIARAPTRIDLAGGWTDVQPFCDHETGLVVNAAFGEITRAAVCFSEQAGPIADPFVRAACKRFYLEKVSVDLHSDAPIGSGLGGSAAAGVALVGALAALAEQKMTRREIAELAHEIEAQDLGILGGKQDQYAAAFGGFLALEFRGSAVRVQPLTLVPERVRELAAHSLVVYTGQSRVSGNIHAHVQEAFHAGNPETLDALATIRSVTREFLEALATGPIEALGALLQTHWAAQKQLHPSITNARVDAFFDVARNAGAAGGKALGAGGGGCLYFLAPNDAKKRLVDACVQLGGQILNAEFDLDGLVVDAADENENL